MNDGRGPYVHAPGGLVDHEDPGIIENLAAHDEFLEVAAGKRPRLFFNRRRGNPELFNHFPGKTFDGLGTYKAPVVKAVSG